MVSYRIGMKLVKFNSIEFSLVFVSVFHWNSKIKQCVFAGTFYFVYVRKTKFERTKWIGISFCSKGRGINGIYKLLTGFWYCGHNCLGDKQMPAEVC